MAGKKIGEAFVRLRPDPSGFAKEFKSNASEAGHEAGEGFAHEMLKTVGELFAGEKILEFFKGAVERASDAAKLSRLTDAVIQSTRGQAHVTADAVDNLARSLSGLSGVDDELIHNAENVLLTFTQVRNSAGKGNDVFNQATRAALNLSAAFHTDLQSASILVGKALNDPVKGATALRRAGVQLTAAQTDQIKKFVESGQVMKAQKIILGELTTEFGGAAAAAATPADKAKVAWQNFQDEIGGLLLPLVDKVATAFTTQWLPAIETTFDTLQEAFKTGEVTAGGFKGAVQEVGATLGNIVAILQGKAIASEAENPFTKAAHIVKDDLIPALMKLIQFGQDVGRWFLQLVSWMSKGSTGANIFNAVLLGLIAAWAAYKIATTAARIATEVYTAAQWLLNAAMDANPIGLIILAIIAIAAAFYYLWTHSEAFRKFWIGLWEQNKNAALAVAHFFATTLPNFFSSAFSKIGNFFQTWYDRIIGTEDKIIAAAEALPGKIVKGVGNLGKTLYQSGIDLVEGFINGILSMGSELEQKVAGFVSDHIPGPVKRLLGIGSPSRLFAGFGRDTIRGYIGGLTEEGDRAREAIMRGIPVRPLAGALAAATTNYNNSQSVTINAGSASDPKVLAAVVARELAWQTGV